MSDIILALSGPRACGKSTIAKHLVNNHGYTRLAFADTLREIAKCAGDQFIDDRNYLARLGTTLEKCGHDSYSMSSHKRKRSN